MPKIDDQLKKAVKEYYEYQGDTKAKPIRFVENKHSKEIREGVNGKGFGGHLMLLVRFVDDNGYEMSSLMDYTNWKDGHWDVTEQEYCFRNEEETMIKTFEDSEEFI